MISASAIRRALLGTLLLAPAAALAQPAPAPAESPPRSGFESLWTGWSRVSRDSIRAETQPAEPGRAPAPEAPRAYQAGSAALGERVGEIVRTGDCEEGERLARLAGDFALVQAVRDHCRRRDGGAG